MPEVLWYYARDNEQQGPVSATQLRQLAHSGALAATDLVWREGMGEWAPAKQIKGLFNPVKDGSPETAKDAAQATASAASTATKESPKESKDPVKDRAAKGPVAQPAPATAKALAAPRSATPPAVTPPAVTPAAATPLPEEAPAPTTAAVAVATEESSSRRSRKKRGAKGQTSLRSVLAVMQGFLWVICALVVLFGGVQFALAWKRSASAQEQAAASAVYAAFFIGAYVVARAGEKISQLLVDHVDHERK
jgi:hypothetical protein